MKSKGFNKKHIYPYLLVAPALITVCCIVFVPAVKAIIMSLQNYDLRYSMNDIKFIGLNHLSNTSAINITGLKIGEEINPAKINTAILNLYKQNYFENVPN